MAAFTEMSGTPTEPLCYITTELAFKLYVVCPMLLAVLNSCSSACWRTFSTDQVFLFVIISSASGFGFLSLFLLFTLIVAALLHASKIGILAFEALIVSQFIHTVVIKLIKVVIWRFL
jgi:hypothetical protein